MSRLLRPSKLEVLAAEPEATKVFDYSLRLFHVFLAAVEATTENAETVNKLGLFISFLDHQTYSFIIDAATYETARTALDNAYYQQIIVVFARHLLMNRTQNFEDTLDEYVQSLCQLARDCEFKAASQERYRKE